MHGINDATEFALILLSIVSPSVLQDCNATSAEHSFNVYVLTSYPVTENACARVCGLDVSDEGDVLQFGEEEQQQTLHPDGRHLKHTHTQGKYSTTQYFKAIKDSQLRVRKRSVCSCLPVKRALPLMCVRVYEVVLRRFVP